MSGHQTTDQDSFRHEDQGNIFVASSGDTLQLGWKVCPLNCQRYNVPMHMCRKDPASQQTCPGTKRMSHERVVFCRGAKSRGDTGCPSSVYTVIAAQGIVQRLNCIRSDPGPCITDWLDLLVT